MRNWKSYWKENLTGKKHEDEGFKLWESFSGMLRLEEVWWKANCNCLMLAPGGESKGNIDISILMKF